MSGKDRPEAQRLAAQLAEHEDQHETQRRDRHAGQAVPDRVRLVLVGDQHDGHAARQGDGSEEEAVPRLPDARLHESPRDRRHAIRTMDPSVCSGRLSRTEARYTHSSAHPSSQPL